LLTNPNRPIKMIGKKNYIHLTDYQPYQGASKSRR
jgi:hypothetical protein